MSASPAAAPQADAQATPQAGTPNTPTDQPQAGKTGELEGLTPAELAQMVRDLRKESGGYRTKLSAFEKEQRDRAQSELSEVEKRDARIRELEESLTGHERRARDYALRDAVAAVVASDEFPVTPVIGAAQLLKLLDTDKVEWGEDGTPKNAGTVLAALARSQPRLFEPKPRRPGGGDAGNLGGATAVGGNEAINRMIRGGR